MRLPLPPHIRSALAAAVANDGSSVVAARAHVARATVFRALRGDRVCDATVHCLTLAVHGAPQARAA